MYTAPAVADPEIFVQLDELHWRIQPSGGGAQHTPKLSKIFKISLHEIEKILKK